MTQYVVVDEHTLGYHLPLTPNHIGVLAAKTGGHHWMRGPMTIVPGSTVIRPATLEDFDAFRVMPPFDFTPRSRDLQAPAW